MSLRRRILLYYSTTLGVSLLIVGGLSWFEFEEQRRAVLERGAAAAWQESPIIETLEIVLFGGLPAVLLGILIGSLLIRRALQPIEDLTSVLEKIDASNLAEPVPRSGNGDELDRMTAVFNGMKERLGVSFTQAREFTLHASHELMTPLTIMHGTLEQMIGDATMPAPHRERITSMLEEVQRLAAIVGQLAFLAKADAGQLTCHPEPVELDELVRDLVEDLTILAANSQLSVTLDQCEAVRLNGDRMRLRQLLLNLADNAVKHNVSGGTIHLSMRRLAGQAHFEIANTGPVLAPALRGRAFERFFRGDPAHGTHAEGCGLGLSIAESIAHAHHGALSLGVDGQGRTRVTLTLPLSESLP